MIITENELVVAICLRTLVMVVPDIWDFTINIMPADALSTFVASASAGSIWTIYNKIIS